MNKITVSSLLLILEKIAQRSLGLVSTLILARLLTPDDFGIIALAMLTLWFVETLTKAGSEAYVIQKDELNDDVVNSAWTLDVILKNFSFLILVLCAPLISRYQEDNSLTTVIIAIGLILPISAFKNPGVWILQRNQDYSRIVKASLLTKFIGLLITIPSAYYLQNYWAIVLGQITSAIISIILSYRVSSYRPKLEFSNISQQWQFSKWIIPQELLSYFRNHVDTLIVSGKLVSSDLGAYNNMKYFASIPMLQFMTPLVAPLHAEMGRVQHNVNEVAFQSDITVKIMAFIAAPFAAIGFVGSEEIVTIILGSQWVQYHKVLSYFSLMIIPFILFTQSVRLLVVKYHTKSIFIYEVLFTVFIVTFLLNFNLSSVEHFAFFRVLSEGVMSIFFYFYATRVVFNRFRVGNILVVIIPSLVLIVVLTYFKNYVLPEFNIFLVVFIFTIISFFGNLVLFCGFYLFFLKDRERNLIKKLSPINIGSY
jgi:lipopolysaccharide exporter